MKPFMLSVSLPTDLEQIAKEERARLDTGKSVSRNTLTAMQHAGRAQDESHSMFDIGRKSMAQSFCEVSALLENSRDRAPPPSTAQQFKQGLIKKYGSLDLA